MKIFLPLIAVIAIQTAGAARMCPTGHLEVVTCREPVGQSVSICRDRDENLLMSYLASPEASLFITEASMLDEEGSLIFTPVMTRDEALELVVKKSVNDHTRGILKKNVAGIQTFFSFRCLTRSL